jgi:hypothetical protein
MARWPRSRGGERRARTDVAAHAPQSLAGLELATRPEPRVVLSGAFGRKG